MKPRFSTLILLTLLSALLLLPFAVSKLYLPQLQAQAFDLHEYLRGNLYKQGTGFLTLAFILGEMALTLRKRGRKWKIKLPGTVLLWRSLHIFVGVGLIGIVALHTIGATGLNYNAVFLWVFFGVSLSALVGVVAETGVVESPRKYFGWVPVTVELAGRKLPFGAFSKGPLIRNMRAVWLSTHIFLVCIFTVMLLIEYTQFKPNKAFQNLWD